MRAIRLTTFSLPRPSGISNKSKSSKWRQSVRELPQQQAQEHKAHLKQHLTNQRVEMLERIPEWRNDETREFERKEVIKYAQKRVGFSEEEISSASDARAIELLYKAWKWDNLMEKKPTTQKAHSPSTEDGQGRATGNQARSC